MYSISQNSPLYGKDALLKASHSVMEATNQQWVDLLTMLHRSGKTKISDMVYVFEMNESQLQRILTQLEREGLVVTTTSMVDITSKGRRWVEKQNPMLESTVSEAALRDRDYEVKNDKIHISKANYKKVHRDYKTKKGNTHYMMAMGPNGTTLYPVVFTEEVSDITEGKLSKNEQRTVAKYIDFLKSVAKNKPIASDMAGMTKEEVMTQLKRGFGLSDIQISKLKIMSLYVDLQKKYYHILKAMSSHLILKLISSLMLLISSLFIIDWFIHSPTIFTNTRFRLFPSNSP